MLLWFYCICKVTIFIHLYLEIYLRIRAPIIRIIPEQARPFFSKEQLCVTLNSSIGRHIDLLVGVSASSQSSTGEFKLLY